MNKFLKMAFQNAMDHDYKDLDFNLCAIIVRGGSVMSVGFNKRGKNSFVEHYTDLAKAKGDWRVSTHAEMDAVLQVRSKIDLSGAKIFVVRKHLDFSKCDSKLAMSRPCVICEQVLLAYGIKKVYYTIDDNHYGVMTPGKVKDKIIRL